MTGNLIRNLNGSQNKVEILHRAYSFLIRLIVDCKSDSNMKKIEFSDLASNDEYLKIREERREDPHALFMAIGGEKAFAQVRRFSDSQMEIHVNHPKYQASTALTSQQKAELAKDLES